MDALLALLISGTAAIGYLLSSARIIEQGNEAIVERLGRFHRTIDAGLNFVVPLVDTVIVESIREQTIDIARQSVITQDELSIEVDAIVYWRIVDIESAYYNVEDLQDALRNLVLAEVRALFGQIDLAQTFSQIEQINRLLLERLDEVTETWGIKVNRVAIQEIIRPEEVRRATERVLVAESERQALTEEAEGKRDAEIAESEGRKLSAISEAEGIVQAMQLISAAVGDRPQDAQVLQQVVQFLVAQRYVDANQKLGASDNAKVVFMDPKTLNEAVSDLIHGGDVSKLRRALDQAKTDGPVGGSPPPLDEAG